MNKWRETELRNHILYKKGFAFKSSLYKNEGRLIVRVSDTTQDSINIDTCVKVDESIANQLNSYELKVGDIVIMTVGSWPDNPASVVGKVIKVPQQANKALLNQNAVRIRSKQTIDKKFLYYKLKSKDFSNYIVNNAQGSANQASITLQDIFSYKFSLPNIAEQKSIAFLLGCLDDKIDLLRNQNIVIEKIVEAVFRKWFFEDVKDEWIETVLRSFIQPKKGVNLTRKEAKPGKFPVVAGGLEPSCFHNESNTKSPVITISASGANAGFIKLYHRQVWASDSSYIDETITPYIYFFYIFLKINQNTLFDKQEGSAQPHIYPSHIMELKILDYPISKIEEYNNYVRPYFDKMRLNQHQITTLASIRDLLLPKLMNGEVRIE